MVRVSSEMRGTFQEAQSDWTVKVTTKEQQPVQKSRGLNCIFMTSNCRTPGRAVTHSEDHISCTTRYVVPCVGQLCME